VALDFTLPGFGGSSPGGKKKRRRRRPRPPGLPGSVTIPGFTPEYGQLIQGDPAYQQLLASLQSEQASNLAQLQAGASQALIGFGEVPDLNALGFGPGLYQLDPTTEALIGKSTEAGVSTLSQLGKAYGDRRRSTVNELAARGILSSGETGYQLGEAAREHEGAQYSARQEVIQYLQGLAAAYAQAQAQRASEQASGAQAAEAFQSALPQNQPTDPFKANLAEGTGWYQGPDGTIYQPNGQKLDVAAAKTALQARMRALRQSGMTWRQIRNTRAWRRWQLLNA
jgi:hypothetical protein